MTSKKMAVGLTCCYFKHLGWPARQIMTNPILTAIIGAYMDTKLSTRRISGFIRANAAASTTFSPGRSRPARVR